MAQKYFRYIPDLEYVNRNFDGQNIGDYTKVKNLFKRGRINSDLLNNIANFSQYKIVGDERPDNVAYKYYGDENLDWLVLLTNNILNIENEWPMSQESFQKYMLSKYGSEEKFHEIHHYETQAVFDSQGDLIVPAGLDVPHDYSITFFDDGLQQLVTISRVTEITNLNYEMVKENNKRNIYLLKDYYANIVIDELEQTMPYMKGSTQYISPDLVRGEDFRIYQ